jgi:hypothetical protein
LWELRNIAFSHYYFDDNCSYQLLSLIEAARPTLDLSSRFPLWVLPVDTIRLILHQEGLFTRAVFRPSIATKLEHLVSHATTAQKDWALRAANVDEPLDEDGLTQLDASDRIVRLDLAYETLTYRTARGAVEGPAREARAWKLLSLRSAVAGPSTVPAVSAPAVRPDEGHGTARVSVGVGRQAGRWYTEAGIRPAFHDQLDRPQGYLQGAQIAFLDTRVRYEEERGVELQQVSLLDIESLSPRNDFFKPKSWRLRLAADRISEADNGGYLFSFEGCGGVSLRAGDSGLMYGLLEAEVQAGKILDPGWATGAGPRTGLLLDLSQTSRIQAEASAHYFPAGDDHTEMTARLGYNLSLSPNNAIRFTMERSRIVDEWESSGKLELLHYFDPVSDK